MFGRTEPGLRESWLNGAIVNTALVNPVTDARMVCAGDETEVRALRDSLQSVFEKWRDERGTFPEASDGLLGGFNMYEGMTLAECPPYACMGERWSDYADLLAKLRAEQYPPMLELEAKANNVHTFNPCLQTINVPGMPVIDAKPGMQRILAALILSEAAAGDEQSAAKAHLEFKRIRSETERQQNEAMRPVQEVVHGLATFAVPFKKNSRKPRKPSPIRKAIARELKKNPSLMPRHLWKILASSPPNGWEFFDNSAGKYIEGPKGGDGMGYARFSEVCKEERDKLAS